ncbi:hypothetical protein THRCLA_21221 [Thraustotheca clavata]|uniref:Uncharacterized protein n=1 Tax=Thraustotheca clavata TaxID=74557 RepID=A0A1V9ZYU7_9STRA|nr:hypothetical protein THRCLA_21221 [Thraustotheca clavata]
MVQIKKQWTGPVYIVLSIACSVVYIELVKDSMMNDFFWPNMTPSGAQMYLTDVFSRNLVMKRKTKLDIFDPANAIIGAYDTPIASHRLWSSYPRYIVFTELTSLHDTIVGFRSFDAGYTFNLFTQYCWVDFDHRWEVAHTLKRQKRCYQRYQTNGAVYLEAIMRNIDWDVWSTAHSHNFMQGVGNFLIQSSEGQDWMSSVPNAFKSINSEVKYWTEKGIINYILQWQNCVQIGISESTAVVNVFGSYQPLTTYHIVRKTQVSKWTTFGLYPAFVSDLWAASTRNASLVRSSTNFFEEDKMGATYVYPHTNASVVIHDVLGPFFSIDTFFIAPSADLIDTIIAFDSVLLKSLQTNATLNKEFQELTTALWDPVPETWRQFDYQYFGGSPMCNIRASTKFVQPSFSFDDVCGQPKPMQITITPQSAAFAYNQIRTTAIATLNICRLCLMTSVLCMSMLNQLDKVSSTLVAPGTAVNLSHSDVEIIQFASLNSTSMILRQPLLNGSWSFFGYIGLYEWVYGHREVISFEGDAGLFLVLSEPLNSIPFTGALDLPNTTSKYLWIMAIATTVVLLAVALVTLILYLHGTALSSHHLLFFNVIAGPVWLGRSLMLLRSTTAIIVLSTSPIAFKSTMGIGRFDFEPRSLFYRLLLAREASWLTNVTSDVLLIFTHNIAQYQAPISNLIFGFTIICLESISPIRATAMVDRSCSRFNMDDELTCTGGVVHIGSLSRALLIVVLNFSSVTMGSVIAKLFFQNNTKPLNTTGINLLPAAALAYCHLEGNIWSIDASIACMSGLFRFDYGITQHVMDTKLWLLFNDNELSGTQTKVSPVEPIKSNIPTYISASKSQHRKKKLFLIAGLIYLMGTVAGSLSYIQLADVNFSNDFWWANFNSSGTLTFIANWYDQYRLFTPYLADVHLDSPSFADTADYSKDNTVVSYSPLYASMVNFHITNDIAIAIHGLRKTNGCLIPWVATQYCWLDFNRNYTMASTSQRQLRCEKYKTNGAVYLEAPLRNTEWSKFDYCWGTSFDIAIANDVHNLNWLSNVKSNSNSEAEEVSFWLNYNINTYTLQWQNYKAIGLIDTFSIGNALGLSYPINLQSTIGSINLDQGSSMKMYWTFARDLWAINMNDSGIFGLSLLRESNRFAYHNITPLDIYLKNYTLSSPLDLNLATFAKKIGPFGSIDMIHVPPPYSLLTLTRQILESLSIVMATNGTTSQHAFQSLPVVATMLPVPMPLKPHFVSGGSFLCGQIPVPLPAIYGMLLFYSSDASCGVQIGEVLFPHPNQIIFAAIAYKLTTEKIPIACSGEMSSPAACINLLQNVVNFTTTYMPITGYHTIIEETIQDVATVELMQYIINTSTNSRDLFHQSLIDEKDPSMTLFGWMYLYDWAVGIREVVQIDGDYATFSVISTFSVPTMFSIDAMEVPRNLAAYCRALCEYVSLILAVIAIVAGLYSILNQFTTEGFNLFETNRVGGLVWIGRPLLIVRSLTALAILSTATLELQLNGNMTFMASSRSDKSPFELFMTKLLAAGEVTWLLYIIQDLAMVFTKETTTFYAPISGMSMWLLSFCLSIAAPVTHVASLNRQCSISIMDYQVECSSGTLFIGSVSRFCTLIALTFVVSTVFYLYHRWRHSISRSIEKPSSLLSCGAQYLFDRSEWVDNGVYYIDYASAALTGLITIPRKSKLYIFDIKVWRILVIDREELLYSNCIHNSHLKKAIPLVY